MSQNELLLRLLLVALLVSSIMVGRGCHEADRKERQSPHLAGYLIGWMIGVCVGITLEMFW